MSNSKQPDSQEILDTYFGVIELARKVRAYYSGDLTGVPRVCSDIVGELIKELNSSEQKMKIVRDEHLFDESDIELSDKQRESLAKIKKRIRDTIGKIDGRE